MPFMVPPLAYTIQDRVYQDNAVQRSLEDLEARQDCLVVVPTGGGKTVIIGRTLHAEAERTDRFKAIVAQHTGFILANNLDTIGGMLSPLGLTSSIVQARKDDWEGDLVFASTPTAGKESRTPFVPWATHLVIDEAHRIGTATCQALIAAAREANPSIRIMRYTATPNRGDGYSIVDEAGGVTYQITYAELIDDGVLVPPRTLTISLGEEVDAGLMSAPEMADDVDQSTIGTLLNRAVHNEAVYEHWLEHASDRYTLGFCATVEHAQDLAETFRSHGVVAEAIWGTMNAGLRQEIMDRFAEGSVQVVFNCMALTEGYDNQRISCIIGLRRFQEEITFLQGIGRGLRALDPSRYPGETKTDCLFLDFTGAAQRHRRLEVRIMEEREARLRANNVAHPDPKTEGEQDNVIRLKRPRDLRHFAMKEFELLADPRRELVPIPPLDGFIGCNRMAWAGAFLRDGDWHVLAKHAEGDVFRIDVCDRLEAVALVDSFLDAEPSGPLDRATADGYPTRRMLETLTSLCVGDGAAYTNRYRAHAWIAAGISRRRIEAAVSVAHRGRRYAA
jgi:DNA repair protein RadD